MKECCPVGDCSALFEGYEGVYTHTRDVHKMSHQEAKSEIINV